MSIHDLDRRRRALVQGGASGVALLAVLEAAPSGRAFAQESPRRGGTLVYAQCSGNRRGGDATNTKHPYFMIDLITRSAYDTLTWVDERLGVVDQLATSVKPTDAKLNVWEVSVREGVRFHDGSEMGARDVAASFALHRLKNFASQQIERIEVIGPLSVRFHLKAGNAEFPFVLAEYDNVVMPAADPDKIGLEGIGTGPFRIVSADPQRRMVFERNERYWRTGLPYLDRLEVVNREGQMESAINGFRARQFDAVLNIDPRLARQLQSEADTELVPASSGDQAVILLPK
ncbi:MAG: ABC transporter substrate-binding protein, partial [Burkholderiaceae bacterium]